MAGTPAVFQKFQLGKESVPGTAVAANKRPLTCEIAPTPATRVQPYRPRGSAAAITSSQAKEWSTFQIEGSLGFVDIVYWLSSLLKQQGGGSPFTILPATFGPETIDTYTLEYGDSVRARRMAYCVVAGLEFTFSTTECSISGDGFGRAIETGISLTGGPTNLAKVIANPKDTVIKIGDSVGSLAALPKGTQASFGIQSRWAPRDYLNADPSFSEHIAASPTLSGSLTMDNDGTADDLLADLRAQTMQVVEIRNVGPEISTGVSYEFRLRFPAILTEQSPSDEEESYVAQFALEPQYDPTFGGWCEFYIVNGLSGL